MSPEDLVVVLADPIGYGIGLVDHVRGDGRLVVVFEAGEDDWLMQEFDAHQLELAAVWQNRDQLLGEIDEDEMRAMLASGPGA